MLLKQAADQLGGLICINSLQVALFTCVKQAWLSTQGLVTICEMTARRPETQFCLCVKYYMLFCGDQINSLRGEFSVSALLKSHAREQQTIYFTMENMHIHV